MRAFFLVSFLHTNSRVQAHTHARTRKRLEAQGKWRESFSFSQAQMLPAGIATRVCPKLFGFNFRSNFRRWWSILFKFLLLPYHYYSGLDSGEDRAAKFNAMTRGQIRLPGERLPESCWEPQGLSTWQRNNAANKVWPLFKTKPSSIDRNLLEVYFDLNVQKNLRPY